VVANGLPRAEPGTTLLSLRGISKSWANRPVLDAVDLDVRAGAVLGIAGGNGAGKTTLLRIAAGIIASDGGVVSFRGWDIERDRAALQREIGFLSAGDRGLYARLTVRQNLEFWGGLARMNRRNRRRRIGDVLSEFEITELADRRVDRLSMGQRQRVRLAVTFLHDPLLVFLDEPRTSLDEGGVLLLESALARLLGKGGAALWASPDLTEPLVSQSWVLEEGRLDPVERAGAGGADTGTRTGIPVAASAARPS
jgi:ABC-2 type transport system ATP-binding protein